jgi:hypothetical protein
VSIYEKILKSNLNNVMIIGNDLRKYSKDPEAYRIKKILPFIKVSSVNVDDYIGNVHQKTKFYITTFTR